MLGKITFHTAKIKDNKQFFQLFKFYNPLKIDSNNRNLIFFS